MAKRYARINIRNNDPSTPCGASTMNIMDKGIDDCDNEIEKLYSLVGTLSSLSTTEKSNLVGAINEVKSSVNTLNDNLNEFNTAFVPVTSVLAGTAQTNNNGYYKCNKQITIVFAVTGLTIAKNTAVAIWTMPEGLRPSRLIRSVIALQGQYALLQMETSGNISIYAYEDISNKNGYGSGDYMIE